LFIVSQHYWVLGDAANRFDNALTDPHAEAHGTHEGSRKYLFGANHVVKQSLLVHATRSVHNQTEYTQEVEFLRNVPAGFAAAQLLTHGHHDSEAWVAMQRLPGRLLLDLIRDGTPYDSRKILLAVLQQLAALEAAGLYHNDVRTWNVLVDTASEAVHLIDYGSIAPVPKDCVWPGNLFLSFFIFVKEVTTAQVDEPDPLRTIAISPFSLPDPYRSWALSFWQKPMSEWTYEQLQQSLLAWADSDADTTAEPQPMWAWMQAVEEAMQALKEHTQHQCHQLQQQLIEQSEQAQQSKKYAQTQLKDLQAQLLKAQEQTCKELQDVHQSNHHHWQLAEQRQKQIEAMQHSWSWRMSWPVRLAGGLVLHPLTTIRKLINQLLAWSLNTFQTPLTKSMAWVLARPQLTSRINGWLMRWPYLHAHLLGMARQNGVLYPAFNRYAAANQDKNKYGEQSQNLAQLSPRARQIYADLKAAIDQQHKGGH
jgi:O-antigen chain-terminating methyltransferase